MADEEDDGEREQEDLRFKINCWKIQKDFSRD